MSKARKEPASGSANHKSEQIQRHQSKPTKVQLQNQLTDLVLEATEESFDQNALDALICALQEADSEPEHTVPSTEESLAQFRQRYAPVFDSVEAAAAEKRSAASKRKHFKYSKALPIAAALVLLLGSMTAQAFGLNVLSALSRWTSQVFRLDQNDRSTAFVRFNPLEEGESATYDTLEDALAAFGIDAPIVPKEIPERFTLEEVVAENWASGLVIYANYISSTDIFQLYYGEVQNFDSISLEKESGLIETYIMGPFTFYITSDLERHKAIWNSGDFECQIHGNISIQELKTIINSIY